MPGALHSAMRTYLQRKTCLRLRRRGAPSGQQHSGWQALNPHGLEYTAAWPLRWRWLQQPKAAQRRGWQACSTH